MKAQGRVTPSIEVVSKDDNLFLNGSTSRENLVENEFISKLRRNFRLIFLILCVTIAVLLVIVLVLGIVYGVRNSSQIVCNLTEATTQGHREHEHEECKCKDPVTNVTECPENKGYRFAAIATENELCSQIGTNILARKWSTAVDAAIATAICLGVVNPHTAGIGGGLYMTIYDKSVTASNEALEAKVLLAGGAVPEGTRNKTHTTGDYSDKMNIAVPGVMKGLSAMYKAYSKLDFGVLFEDSIKLCDGFKVGPSLAQALLEYEDRIRIDRSLRKIFLKDDELYKEGDIMTRPDLKATLMKLANNQPLYTGPLQSDILSDIEGTFESDDLKNYEEEFQDASPSVLSGRYMLYTTPLPSGGAFLKLILNILDGFDLGPSDLNTPTKTTETYSRILMSFKSAFGLQHRLGHRDEENVTRIVEQMDSETFIQEIQNKIRMNTLPEQDEYSNVHVTQNEEMGTTHVSVLSSYGGAVSLTMTLGSKFGSFRRGEKTGIIYNDLLKYFTMPEVNGSNISANVTPSYNRPVRTSAAPSIITDTSGKVVLVSGASGGHSMISANALSIIKHLWLKQNLEKSVNDARIDFDWKKQNVVYEDSVLQEFPSILTDNRFTEASSNHKEGDLGIVHAVSDNCTQSSHQAGPRLCIEAVSDKRGYGEPDGY